MTGTGLHESPVQLGHTPNLARNVIFALAFATTAEGVFLGGILPILPAIRSVYQITHGQAFWVNASFLLAVGVTCPTLSRLGDIYGHKKLAVITLIMTSLGIFIDVIAPTYFWFLVGRFFLGLCPAVVPLSVGIFRKLLPKETALFGISMIFATMAAGHAVGPVFAGYVFRGTGSISWVFASWLALFIPAVLIVLSLVPKIPVPSERLRMDWLGAIMLGIGVGCVLFGLAYGPLAGWKSSVVIGAFCVGIVSLSLWYLAEKRAEHPLVDLRMLGDHRATPYYVSSFLWGAAYYGSQTTVVLFMGTSYERWGFGFSASAVTIGWLLLLQHIANMFGSLIVKRGVKSWGYRRSGMIGGVLMGLGYAGMMLTSHLPWQFNLFAVFTLFGSGFMQPILPGRVSEVCGESQRGISAGMFQTFKNIGGSAASAIGSAVFAAMVINGTKVASKGAYIAVFGGCLVLSFCMTLFIAGDQRPSDKSERVA